MAKRNQRYRKRRRRRGLRIFLTLLTFCIVVGAIIASLTVFLKVAKIEVNGTMRYTSEQILETSGIEIGDNLFAVNKFAVRDRILETYPYIDSVEITRRLPDTFVFQVTERTACAYVDTEDQRWLVDKGGHLLERTDITQPQFIAKIVSDEPLLAPFEGGLVTWEQEGKDVALATLLTALSDKGLIDRVQEVNVSALYSLEFTYENRLRIMLGTTEDLTKKFNMLDVVLPKLAPTDRGVLNVSSIKEARFTPERAAQ